MEESFPGIEANIARAEALGFPWESKVFVKQDNGEIVSHVSCLDYPILIDGEWHRAAALHAICTKQTHRHRGLASKLIQEALEWANTRYEFVVLFTEIPQFYERLGFHCIPEHRFRLACQRPKGCSVLRPIASPHDTALFANCFRNRTPLSQSVWVQDHGSIASFNTLFATYPTYWSLHYSPTLNGLISYELKDKTLHLYDVIANPLPSLEAILDHLPSAIETIYFYFSPDQLTQTAIPEPYLQIQGHFLVHGTWMGQKPFMIAPLSRC